MNADRKGVGVFKWEIGVDELTGIASHEDGSEAVVIGGSGYT
jgi:hypothetical protein